MNSVLELSNVSIAIDSKVIVRDINIVLPEGNIGCLLGASGCGKTTLLRGIAGFEKVVAGTISIDGHIVGDEKVHMNPESRHVGMVFQDFALFPHLSVRENIVFGLQHLPRNERKKRMEEVAGMLEISDLIDDYPHRLSGGQQQRVALARAIAPRPEILLLDEPFASMDIALREQIAREMRAVLKEDGITAILVSHNQYEAFAMADEIGVMCGGQLLQWDTAFQLYHRPASPYVADFIGEGVFLSGKVIDSENIDTELGVISQGSPHGYDTGMRILVLIRPDDIVYDQDSNKRATILEKVFRGAEFLYTLGLGSGEKALCLVPSHNVHALGDEIGIRLDLEHLVIFPAA